MESSSGLGPADNNNHAPDLLGDERSTDSSLSLLDDPNPDPPSSSQSPLHAPLHGYHAYNNSSWNTDFTLENSGSGGGDMLSRPQYNNNSNNNNFHHQYNEDNNTADDNSSSNSSGSSARINVMRQRRFARQHRHARPTTIPETIQESPANVRQSLDAGMVALRRWIRSSRAVRNAERLQQQQQRPHDIGSSHSMAIRDDLAAMPPYHSNNRASRQRALSEPEGIQLREAHFQRAVQDATEAEERQEQREARTRWYQINRRFQFTITIVALIFSLLLFAILVCWVVLTSAYVVSIDKSCNVPLKSYYWLATFQLVLDVFRTDIMRFLCRYQSNNNGRIPHRVIFYNVCYLIYALLVLRLGIRSVYMHHDSLTCNKTAPELYQSSRVFVSLSIAAWSTIVFGYLVPFCFVATLLTWNGYNPTANNNDNARGVFPAAYTMSTFGAPAETISMMRTVLLEEFPTNYPNECCICMSDFVEGDAIVATECHHVFHKRCCQEWLKQARTCPVCRTDIPMSYENCASGDVVAPADLPSRREPTHVGVVNLIRMMGSHQSQQPTTTAEVELTDIEDGRASLGGRVLSQQSI